MTAEVHAAGSRAAAAGSGAGRAGLAVVARTAVAVLATCAAVAAPVMDPSSWSVTAAVLAVGWAAAGTFTARRGGLPRLADQMLAVAVDVSAVALLSSVSDAPGGPTSVVRAVLLATLPATSAQLAVSLPRGSIGSRRAGLVASVWVLAVPLVVVSVARRPAVPTGLFVATSVVLAGVSVLAFAAACRRAERTDRARLQWDGWGVLAALALATVVWACSVLTGVPSDAGPLLAAVTVLVPAGLALSSLARARTAAPAVLAHTIVATGTVVVVAAVLLVVVVGLGGTPEDSEQSLVALVVVAGAAAVTGALWSRARLQRLANERIYGERTAPDEALRTFAARMSRSVPMDELLLQLAESLRSAMDLSLAEVWTGGDGTFERHVSVPNRGRDRLELGADEAEVASRTRIVGNSWLAVWAPALLEGRGESRLRVAPIAHLGELLGFVVVERPSDALPFDEEEDRVLGELTRHVGLALHNVRLDSALQASLDELQARNLELQASRARIVAASDESRRRIERDLHDGAQQHLVAMAVKVGLARQLLVKDPAMVDGLLEELRDDVQTTVGELRELAHGIFPPLLRDRGLGEALGAAANRSPLPVVVDVDVERFEADLEAVVYFCCLEAIQNAGKHAGASATVTVTVRRDGDRVTFSVSDDGAGFDPATVAAGHGFVNMEDRLGSVGGTLRFESAPGSGTTVSGTLPVPG